MMMSIASCLPDSCPKTLARPNSTTNTIYHIPYTIYYILYTQTNQQNDRPNNIQQLLPLRNTPPRRQSRPNNRNPLTPSPTHTTNKSHQGGQAGIGREITAQLLLHGITKVFILATKINRYLISKEEWARRPGIELGKDDGRVEFVQCDLGQIHDVKRAADEVRNKTGRLDVVICNAGMSPSPPAGL